MMHDSYSHRQQNPPVLESMEIVVALSLMAICWFAWYVARERFYFTNRQIAELACYLALGGLAIIGSSILIATARSRRERQWPHPPMVVSRKRDEQFTADAWKQDAVVLGYDIHGKPWYWPDKVRVMQGIVLGMTGSGKTTLLKNIITQDMARVVGTPKDPHRLPMVIFDGKGDLEFFYDLLPHVHRAGRLHQLRVLNPARPDISVRYNPFYCSDEDYMSVVNMVFGSFNLHDEFFAKHQELLKAKEQTLAELSLRMDGMSTKLGSNGGAGETTDLTTADPNVVRLINSLQEQIVVERNKNRQLKSA